MFYNFLLNYYLMGEDGDEMEMTLVKILTSNRMDLGGMFPHFIKARGKTG